MPGNRLIYGSYGNGFAIRVSDEDWLYDTLEKTRQMAQLTAEVTHSPPEEINRAGAKKPEIISKYGFSGDY